MLLMDAGCELHGYSSDVTRTWPVSGTFTRHQREVYEIVLDTHRCVLNQQPFVQGRCLPAGTRSGSGAAAMPAHRALGWRLAVEVPRVHILGMGLNMFLAQLEAPKFVLVRRWGNCRAGPVAALDLVHPLAFKSWYSWSVAGGVQSCTSHGPQYRCISIWVAHQE